MKKLAMTVVAFFFVLTLAACGGNDSTPVDYTDGTYTAQSEDGGHGYEDVSVVIADGKIDSVTLRRMNSDETEVNYASWNGIEGNDGKTRPNLDQFRNDLAEDIVEAQGTDGVDTIATATRSTQAWIDLVQECLDEATE